MNSEGADRGDDGVVAAGGAGDVARTYTKRR